MIINSTFIKEVKSFNSGGGCIIDYVVLSDGQVIGINDECMVLYADEDELIDSSEKEDWDNVTIPFYGA